MDNRNRHGKYILVTIVTILLILSITGFVKAQDTADLTNPSVYSVPTVGCSVNTGAASYKIPIEVPPGRKGMQPNISLIYNSYTNNGWIGEGWSLDIGYIQRATKDGLTYIVEAKHHINYHSLTGLDESRIARAIIEDVTDAYTRGVTKTKIDRAMIVTNTKYSEHAINYGICRDILQVGWASPDGFGIRDTVEKYHLYPLSCLRGLSAETRLRFVEVGIVLIKQLLEQDSRYLERKIGLPQQTVLSIMEKAKHTTETLWY